MADNVKTTAAAKKAAPAKKAAAPAPVKTAPAKKPAAAPAVEAKEKEATPRVSKWLAPTLKLLAQHPDGLSRAQIWEALETKDLGGVLVNNPDLFEETTIEDVKGKCFKLTKAGIKKAATVE